MAKFQRKGQGGTPGISTASLPDIVFMLLFFFMVSTSMREVELKVKVSVPSATEVTKLENKSLVSFIYVGEPLDAYKKILGTEPRIQVNDRFVKLNEIKAWVDARIEIMDERDRRKMTVSIKSDKKTKMGIITDIKEELKKANALKINYSTRRDVQN